jgi:hypothetical protein
MANLTSSQIKDSYQSVLTTSETTSDPTTGTLQNGKGTAITTLTVSGTVNATTLGGTLSTASQPNVTSVGTLSSATISGDLTVDTSTLKVDSANNRVGIGLTNPSVTLHAKSAGYGEVARFVDTTENGFKFTADAFNGFNQIDSGSQLLLSITGTERMRIDASGNVGIGLAPTSRNNTRLQIVDGIGFPATQVASSDPNTLDDYEEGTFDFGIAFGGSSVGVTYTIRAGQYTKVGRKVTVTGYIILSSKGAEVGNATITGLPFVVGTGDSYLAPASIGLMTSISFADFLLAYASPNSQSVALAEMTNAGVLSSIDNTNFVDTSAISISLTYFTA